MKKFFYEVVGGWVPVLLAVVNMLVTLAMGACVAGWSDDLSEIGGYTFVVMLLVAGIECAFLWRRAMAPACAIAGVLVGMVGVILLF